MTPPTASHSSYPAAGASAHGEDINIPLVAVSVAGFAAFLIVIIVALQAWFYNTDTAERASKIAPQGAPGTPLGDQLARYSHDLYDPAGPNDRLPGKGAAKPRRVPIDLAIDATVKEYAAAQSGTPIKP